MALFLALYFKLRKKKLSGMIGGRGQGTILDRYGKPTEGRFLSPEGTDFESRSLPSYIKTAEYTRYMVNKPFPVSEGQAAPFYWFNSSGGGTQYYLKNDISYYIEKGYIKIIK